MPAVTRVGIYTQMQLKKYISPFIRSAVIARPIRVVRIMVVPVKT